MWGHPDPHTVSKNAESSGSGDNTAEVITLAAVENERHVLDDIHWSYNGAATTGKLTIAEGGVTTFDVDLITAAADNGSVHFEHGFESDANTAVVVTLAAGAAGIAGKLNLNYR